MSYKLPKTLLRVAKSRGIGCVEVVKFGVGVFAFGVLWHKTSAFLALVCLAAFLWWRSRRGHDATDPQLQRIFEATAGLLRIRTEELDPKSKKLRPVPAQRWVRFASDGGIDLDFPGSFEAAGNNVSRVREQVERTIGALLVATVTPGIIHLRPRPVLPKKVAFRPSPAPKFLAFGAGEKGAVGWPVSRAPHGLVSGATGSGKTVAMRALIFSALDEGWEVVGCDPKRIELSWLRGRARCTHASNLDDMANAVANVRMEMMRRYDLIDAGSDLDVPPLLLVVDEATSLLSQAAEEKLRVVSDLSEIARLGRAADVHLLLGMQRPDSGKDALPGELKHNLDFRLAVGPHDSIASRMVLDSDDATVIDGTVGRAVAKVLGSCTLVQVAYTPHPREDLAAVAQWLPAVEEAPAPALQPISLVKTVESAPTTVRKVRKSA